MRPWWLITLLCLVMLSKTWAALSWPCAPVGGERGTAVLATEAPCPADTDCVNLCCVTAGCVSDCITCHLAGPALVEAARPARMAALLGAPAPRSPTWFPSTSPSARPERPQWWRTFASLA